MQPGLTASPPSPAGRISDDVLARCPSHTLLDLVSDAVVVTDLNGVVTFWNAAATRTFGWTSGEMVGRHVLDRIPEGQRAEAADTLAGVLGGAEFVGRVRGCHRDGREVWVDSRLVRVADEAGRPVAVVGVSRDVTEWKRTEDRQLWANTIVETTTDAIMVTEAAPIDSPGPRVVYVNQAYLDMTGYTRDEVIGQTPRIAQGPGTERATLDRIRESLRAWRPIRAEVLNYHKSGAPFWAELDINPVWDDRGRVTHWVSVQRNVTERKRVEDALRASETSLRVIGDNLPAGAVYQFRIGPDGDRRFLYVSQGIEQLVGLSPEQVLADPDALYSLVLPEDFSAFQTSVVESMARLTPWQHEFRGRTHDGTVRWLHGRSSPRRAADGATVWDGVFLDVTARKAAEAETAHKLARIDRQKRVLDWLARQSAGGDEFAAVVRRLTEQVADVFDVERASVWLLDDAAAELRCIDLFVRGGGHTSGVVRREAEYGPEYAALKSSLFVDAHNPLTDPRTAGYVAGHLTPNRITALLDAVIRFGGRNHGTLCLEHVGRPHTWQADEIDFACLVAGQLSVCLESLARRTAEGALRERERFLSAVLDGSPVGIQVFTPAGTSVRMNPAMQGILGLPSPEIGVGEYNLLTDPVVVRTGLAAAFRRAAAGEVTRLDGLEVDFTAPEYDRWPLNRRRWRQDCVYFPVFDTAGVVEAVVVFTWDVTARLEAERERERLEGQLRQTQKMEAIGQLAGGVAHDFNNILTAVIGFAELLQASAPAPSRPLADQILRAGQRGAALTRQLLAFSRRQIVRQEVLDLNAVIDDTGRLLHRLIGEDVRLETRLAPSLGPIRADRGQVEQVVMNLAVNARDAMPKGGRLVVETANEPAGPPPALPGPVVRLTVTDTGCGMTDEVKARIFEPFFTTKEPGKGTGLGLATVYGIVQQAGGAIAVDTEVGRGTAFHVYLPRVDATSDPPRGHQPPAARGRGERILVVEDDDDVRGLTKQILEGEGYRVTVAASGEEAMAVCRTAADRFELVLSDVVMPGMDGRELSDRLTAQFPQTKVVFLSGYTDDAVLRRGVETDQVAFLHKPYTTEQLKRAVRAALDT